MPTIIIMPTNNHTTCLGGSEKTFWNVQGTLIGSKPESQGLLPAEG